MDMSRKNETQWYESETSPTYDINYGQKKRQFVQRLSRNPFVMKLKKKLWGNTGFDDIVDASQ